MIYRRFSSCWSVWLMWKCFHDFSRTWSDILRKTDNKSCYYWKVILVIFYGTEYRGNVSRILLSDSALLLVMVPARASQNFENSQKMGKTEWNSGKNAEKCKKKRVLKGFAARGCWDPALSTLTLAVKTKW